jgi:hypothetical protein
MKSIMSITLASLVQRTNPDLQSRLEAQDEALSESECITPVIGRWVDAHDVEFLISALDLDDVNFAKRFPAAPQLNEQRRRDMKAEIESHLNHCRHCSLTHGYELELDARIMRAFRENKTDFMNLLDKDEAGPVEGDHISESKINFSQCPSRPHAEPQIF